MFQRSLFWRKLLCEVSVRISCLTGEVKLLGETRTWIELLSHDGCPSALRTMPKDELSCACNTPATLLLSRRSSLPVVNVVSTDGPAKLFTKLRMQPSSSLLHSVCRT